MANLKVYLKTIIRKLLPAGTFLLFLASTGPAQIIWVTGETEKVNPYLGSLASTGSYRTRADYSKHPLKIKNQVWDDSTRTVTLAAARGEILGFQVIVEKGTLDRLSGIHLSASDLQGPGGAGLSGRHFEFFREYYIRKGGSAYPDPLIPLEQCPDYDYFSIPDEARLGIKNVNQAVWVDLFVPQQAAAGVYHGGLAVTSAETGAFEINVNLTVYDFSLPDIPNYDYEFNHYGLRIHNNWPGGVPPDEKTFLEFERNSYRLCQKNRLRLNLVPYNQDGSPAGWLQSSMWPVLAGSGDSLHVADWSAWDSRFGPYLDGSAFADLPQGPVPIAQWMLPFNHRFASDYNQRWHADTQDFPFWDKEPVYQVENLRIMAEFEEHLNQRGWNVPLYHVFYNEKGRNQFKDVIPFGDNQLEWFLDEPVKPVDFEALRFYSTLVQHGFHNTLRPLESLGDPDVNLPGFPSPDRARFIFRADIGTEKLLKGYLDGYIDLWNIGGAADEDRYNFSEVAARRDKGERVMFYGPWYYQFDSYNLDLLWSGWNDWRRGALGHEMWLAVGWIDAMATDWNQVLNDDYGGATTYIYPGFMLGLNSPAPTHRMKVIRRGVQDWEYLYRLTQLTGSRDAADKVMQTLMNTGDQTYDTDLKKFKFDEAGFTRARAELARLILAAGGAPVSGQRGDYSGDGRLALNDAFLLILRLWQKPVSQDLDYNGDGFVNIVDVIALIKDILLKA